VRRIKAVVLNNKMKLDFYNCPAPGNIKEVKLPEAPEFVSYAPKFKEIEKYAKEI